MNSVGPAEGFNEAKDSLKNTKGYQRVVSLFDEGSFQEIGSLAKSGDGFAEAVAGYGMVNGCPAYVFSQNSDVDGGAMSKAQASKIRKVFSLAAGTGTPVIGVYDSVGGRLNEGGDMLSAYGDILLGANNLSGVVPQIALVLGPCTGTSAMIAAGADLIVMSEKGELTIATNGEGGKPEEAEKLGLCHLVEKNEQAAIEKVRGLLSMLPSNNLSGAPVFDAADAVSGEITAENAMACVCDESSLIELGKNFGPASTVALARVGGTVAGMVSLTGVIDAESCSKAARFVRFCDSFSLPVITFVNAEKFASLREASKLSSTYSEATTAKVAVLTGSAYGAVYIAVAGRGANADYTFAWPKAVVSALNPETAAIFLWNDRLAGSADPVNDRKMLIEEFKATQGSAMAAAAEGMIEDVVAPEETRSQILLNLDMLSGKRVSTLPKKHTNIQL